MHKMTVDWQRHFDLWSKCMYIQVNLLLTFKFVIPGLWSCCNLMEYIYTQHITISFCVLSFQMLYKVEKNIVYIWEMTYFHHSHWAPCSFQRVISRENMFWNIQVRMAERSKALRSGRSLVLQAWVRIPLLTYIFILIICRSSTLLLHLQKKCTSTKTKRDLPDGESNPGLPRDRRGYSPLYYQGSHMWQCLLRLYEDFIQLKIAWFLGICSDHIIFVINRSGILEGNKYKKNLPFDFFAF